MPLIPFFTNIGPETQKNIPDVDSVTFDRFLDSPIPSSLFLHPVTSDDILNKIILLKNSSAGYDEISPVVIKYVANLISKPLCHIFNLSLYLGNVPARMKIARVVPIFKNDDKELVTNYRPISVLPCFSKILEKIVFEKLYSFLMKHNVFYNYQFGFLPGRSTSHALLHLSDMIMNAFEKRHFVSGTFLDLS